MIVVKLEGHDYDYEIGELIKIFYSTDEFKFTDKSVNAHITVNSEYKKINDKNGLVCATICEKDEEKFKSEQSVSLVGDKLQDRKMVKKIIKLTLFNILSQYSNKTPKWGILTGIRPTKIVHELLEKGKSIKEIRSIFKDEYKLHETKIDLIVEISNIEKHIMKRDHDYVSLYIGIPFCPTKCLYCSFPSNSINKKKDRRKEYLDVLIHEIKEVSKLVSQSKKIIDTVYIGGGTPTAIEAEQLELLLKSIEDNFDLRNIREYTVEAGRPDTITREKLQVIKNYGIERISINPQTMNDKTLRAIGRKHTVDDVKNTYELAKEIGFETINMDIIIGLPGETVMDFENTMQELEILNPENITVHTLAVKKSSLLKLNRQNYSFVDEKEAIKMVNIANEYCRKMGMSPYYMYRQKYMVGNLENIGYSKFNHQCIYNVEIIEEKQSIIALGAGATSKFYYDDENRLERVPNVTDLDNYINRIDEMIERKKKEMI